MEPFLLAALISGILGSCLSLLALILACMNRRGSKHPHAVAPAAPEGASQQEPKRAKYFRDHDLPSITRELNHVRHQLEGLDESGSGAGGSDGASCEQLLCRIADSNGAQLAPVFAEALPFIAHALSSSTNNKVLVHCERGASRSASVVAAYLMDSLGIDDIQALEILQDRRSAVRPNTGFRQQLRDLARQKRGLKRARASDDQSAAGLLKFYGGLCDMPEQMGVKVEQMGHWLQQRGVIQSSSLPHDLGSVLTGVLSAAECSTIIAETESIGFGRTPYPQKYRGNRRLMVDDQDGSMVAALWSRIQNLVPAVMDVDWLSDCDGPTGRWRAVGLNSRFRFSKYFQGERFDTHKDSMVEFDCDKCTLLTVNMYLNELTQEQNGRTRFFLERHGEPVCTAGGPAGSAVIFKQRQALHDGEPLVSGLKYLMRTDVIYTKVGMGTEVEAGSD